MRHRIIAVFLALALGCVGALAAVPNQFSSLDPGGRSMGAGGAFYATNADTFSAYYNPAGLGYLNRRDVEVALRTLPGSRTNVSGTYASPVHASRNESGNMAVTHIGYAMPLHSDRPGSGTIAFAYTVGGNVDDVAKGPAGGLPDGSGAFTINNFVEKTEAKSEFLSVAYGATNATGDMAYGLGIVYLKQSVSYSQSGTGTGGAFTPFSLSSDGNGFGLIGGVQYSPPKMPGFSVGASIRTPIELTNNSETSALLDRVPGRALIGAAYRYDGLRGGKDFVVLGLQIQHFFGGRGNFAFSQNDHTVTGLGLEYSYQISSGRIAARLGHVSAPGGGSQFGSGDSFTYGLGYRPNKSDFSVDLNWGNPRGGGREFAVVASFKFH